MQDEVTQTEQPDPAIGEVQWHSSEEDGGPDVGILLGLGEGKMLWCGEIADKHGLGATGLAIYRGTEAEYFPFDFESVRDVLMEHVAPAIKELARHRHQAEREEEEAYKIGISEGRQEMVREIDLATGGDGEFRWSTEPDRHCPCEEAMKARVIERFHQAERETLARMEPVAWMYEREGHQPQVSLFRWRDIVDGKLVHGCGDWTETPLYTLPPAPEAGQ